MTLINRLIARALKPASFEQLYTQARSSLQSHSTSSVADATLSALRIGRGDELLALKAAPWLSCLLLKWRLQLNDQHREARRSIPLAEFDRLRQMLWEFNTIADAKQDAHTQFNARAWFRSAIVVQAEFQRAQRADFFRWPAVINTLDSSHVVRRQFESDLGMGPAIYMDLAMATFAAATGYPDGFSASWFAPLRQAYGDSIDAFLALLSRDLQSLREEILRDPYHSERRRSEMHEFPFQKRYPLLQTADSRFVSWHPAIFFCGIDEAVHLRLSDRKGAYAQPFGSVFESYVLRLLTESQVTFIPETVIRSAAGSGSITEALVESGDANVFIEAKMGLFPDIPLATDDTRKLRRPLEPVLKALDQGWSMTRLVRNGKVQLGQSGRAVQDFLIVVTSRELYLGGGLNLRATLEPFEVNCPSPLCERYMPLQNVFIMGIDQFELLMSYIKLNRTSLDAVLCRAAEANRDHSTSKLIFMDHLPQFELPSFPSALVDDAKRTVMDRVSSILGHVPPLPAAEAPSP